MRVPRGSIMLEALLAIGIAAVFMTSMIALVLLANATGDRAVESQKAIWAAQEGAEAIKTIAWNDLAITNAGSLSFASNNWTLSTTGGPQTLADGSTRTVRVQNVQRDASCLVVASGGTNDDDTRAIESEVAWTDNRGTAHTVTNRTLRTNWEDPSGACFGPTTQAGAVSFAFQNAQFSGGKQLRNVFMTNTGGATVTIDRIHITWSNSTTFDQLFIDTSKVWSASGPGTPSGSITSGTMMDIQNFNIAPNQTVEVNKGQFSGPMSGTTINMTVYFADGSSYSSGAIQPN